MQSLKGFYGPALAQIRELKGTRPELASLLDYYAAVVEAQQDAKLSFHPDLDGLDVELRRSKASEGLPLLGPEDIKVDWGLFDSLFDRISQISRERAETPDGMGSWPSISRCNREWHDALLAGLLKDKALLDESAEGAGISPDTFAFLACQTAVPFLETYAERLKDSVDDSAWFRGYCPICGAEPLMGKLDKETGKRTLQCHLCRTDWAFQRLQCPFCGTSDQEKLRFFWDQEDPAHRVEVCDLCKTYLKTVDARETDEGLSLLVENLATLHLDLVAKREGFERETNRLFGL